MLTIADLAPDQFRIDLKAKITELVVSLTTKHEQSGQMIHIYEYLIGDDTGCMILNTKLELQIDAVYDIKNAFTGTVAGYLRLYATEIELAAPCTGFNTIMYTQNNRSAIIFERKAF